MVHVKGQRRSAIASCVLILYLNTHFHREFVPYDDILVIGQLVKIPLKLKKNNTVQYLADALVSLFSNMAFSFF